MATETGGTGQQQVVRGALAEMKPGDAAEQEQVARVDPRADLDDTTAPAKPIITAPIPGARLAIQRPLYRGDAEANSKVRLYIKDVELPEVVTVGGNGHWEFDADESTVPGSELTEGVNWIRATAEDAAGNVSLFSDTIVFSVDVTKPVLPTISYPTEDLRLNAGAVIFQGTAEAGTTVKLMLDGPTEFASVISSPPGNWVFAPQASLFATDAQHELIVSSIDAAGNHRESAARTFFIDNTAPATTLAATGPSGAVNQTSATFTFTSSDATATFECQLDTVAPFATCTSPKSYTTLAPGTHTFSVRAKDEAGNVDPTPAVRTWLVDLASPAAPMLSAPLDGAFLNTQRPTITGTAEAGSTVEVFLAITTPAVSAGTVTAGADGRWSLTVPADLLDGTTYKVTAKATDSAGNPPGPASAERSFTVDVTPPETNLAASGPSGAVSQTTATFTFTSPDATATFECQLDNAPQFTVCTSPKNYPTVAAGAHTFLVRAKDKAGNVDPTPAVRTWLVDLTSPAAPMLSAPLDGAFLNTQRPTITGTAEAGSTVEVFLAITTPAVSAGTVTAGADGRWSLTVAADLLDGTTYKVTAKATDSVGNPPGPASAGRSFTVDVTPPETNLAATGPSGAVSQTTATFTFTAAAPDTADATFECQLDNAPQFTVCTSPKSHTGLGAGAHVFYVRAKDRAGNVDPTPAVRTWLVDQIPPNAPLLSEPIDGAYLNTQHPTITGTAEAGSTVEVFLTITTNSVSAGTVTAGADGRWSLTVAATLLDATTYKVQATAKDPAGNTGSLSLERSFTVDVTDPQTILISGPSGPQQADTATFKVSSDEPGDPVKPYECSLDNAPFVSCPAEYTVTGLGGGGHTMQIRARDRAGNYDHSPLLFTWIVDSVVPQTLITLSPAKVTKVRVGTFEFSSNKPDAVFECSVDPVSTTNPPYNSCSTPFTTNSLNDGLHKIVVRARDTAGNEDTTPALYEWTVDGTAPETTILTGPTKNSGETTNSLSAQFTFSSTEPGSFLCRLDDALAGFTTCGSGQVWSGLSSEPHKFEVKTVDVAGNEDLTPAVWLWDINLNLPDTVITEQPGPLINTLSATFRFTVTDPVAFPAVTFLCSLNQSTYVLCTSPYTVTVIGNGEQSFRVKVRDILDKEDPEPASATWRVDTQRPTPRLLTQPTSLVNVSLGQFTFDAFDELNAVESGGRFECSLDEAPFVGCNSPIALDFADGPHSLQLRAWDAAGNMDATPVIYSWRVDTQAPAAPSLTAPASDALVATATPTLEGNGEPGSSVFVTLDDVPVGTATVNDSGRWSLTLGLTMGEGARKISVRAKDPAGNEGATSEDFLFTVDTVAPETSIVTGPEGRVRQTLATFQFSSTEEGVTFECSLDNAEFTQCAADSTFDVLEGGHSLQVRARDRAGNVDPSPETHAWRLSLGSDTRTLGGGLSCSSSGGGVPFGMLAGLVGLALMAVRRRRG
ncbi:MAG: hypothetical protein EOO71_34500 [Myxococcaceae bacterium]|nr:MAG: hypothetical protein EOO71_34500 [Myxococcaceae bacterium]